MSIQPFAAAKKFFYGIGPRRPDISAENVIAQVRDGADLQVLVLVHDPRREEHVFQGPIL